MLAADTSLYAVVNGHVPLDFRLENMYGKTCPCSIKKQNVTFEKDQN